MTIESEGPDRGGASDTSDTSANGDTSDTSASDTSDTSANGDTSAAGDTRGAGHTSGCASESSPLSDIQDLVGDLVDGVRSLAPSAVARHPRYDFVETVEAYLLVFDLPGVERGEVSVTTEGEDIVVSGERRRPDWGEGATVRRTERASGKFRRAMRLPADVRMDDVKARLDAGILTVTLPRRDAAAGGRKVDIEG